MSDFPDSATENAGRGGFNLQEFSVDINGVDPDLNDMPREDTTPATDLSGVIDALVQLGDQLDEEGEEEFVNLVDMVLSKHASDNSNPSQSFNAILQAISDSELVNQNDAIIDMTKKFSQHIKLKRLQGMDLEEAKAEALENAVSQMYQLMQSNGLTKMSAFWGSNSPSIIAQSLADTIRILISRMSPQSQGKSIINIRNKLNNLNPSEMSQKKAPGGALIGTSLSLIKNVLNGREPGFISSVLKELANRL